MVICGELNSDEVSPQETILRSWNILRMRSGLDGADDGYLFGLMTNLNYWCFTCYIFPEEDEPVQLNNFVRSSIIDASRSDKKKVLSQIMQFINAIICGEVGKKMRLK
jgi:hypothetical protein